MNKRKQTILVTGGAGYVGSVLTPRLLKEGYKVKVVDLFWYGKESLAPSIENRNLTLIEADIRDQDAMKAALSGCDAVIHLACISNDPSFDLDPDFGRTINLEAFEPLVDLSVASGVRRFIYASTSSVYGVSRAAEVTEDHPLAPLTDYSKYKAQCEPILMARQSGSFTPVAIRPSTVCGCSPRQRMDLVVNILTNHAVHNGRICVFGGEQMRPNIHIEDMVDFYVQLVREKEERIKGKIFNVGSENHSVADLALMVKEVVESEFPRKGEMVIQSELSDDIRSYRVTSKKAKAELGYEPKRTVKDAIRDLCRVFKKGRYPHSLSDARYFNIKRMQDVLVEQSVRV